MLFYFVFLLFISQVYFYITVENLYSLHINFRFKLYIQFIAICIIGTTNTKTLSTRQQIEQIFDIGKNHAEMLPVKVQNEDTFRGHLLLTFMATILCKMVQDELKETKLNPQSMFLNLRNHKCKVYEHAIITQEAFKKAGDCYKLFDIECPVRIPIN